MNRLGRIGWLDLNIWETREEGLDPQIARDFIGGRGLGVKILSDNVEPEVDPLAPENLLIFAVGPLTGIAPMGGRHAVVSKSPLTNTIFDSSSGGFFGGELRYAGWAAVIIEGQSEKPAYLEINSSGIEVRSAEHLWGLNVGDCTRGLEPLGRVACIGRAGEKLVAFASIMNDYSHAAGRGGLGAVMGSKKLKAIVVREEEQPPIRDKNSYEEARREAMSLLGRLSRGGLATYGTPGILNLINTTRLLPTRNFRETCFGKAESLSGEYIKENLKLEKRTCQGCAIACRHVIKEGEFAGLDVPEYETIWAFGPDNNNESLASIIKANQACNEYGIDTISCGSTIACYAENIGKDISPEELPALVEEIGEKKDIGKKLGGGSRRYVGPASGKDKSIHVKGLELPGYDPRGALGQALAYATSNRGGCHLRAYLIAPEVLGRPEKIDRLTFQDKPQLVKKYQDLAAVIDSLVVCKFSDFALTEKEYARLLSATTGTAYTPEELLNTGERIWNLERIFNIKAGYTREDDTLPLRFFEGKDAINKKEFEDALDEYYQIRGWNSSGKPTKEKMMELRLYAEPTPYA